MGCNTSAPAPANNFDAAANAQSSGGGNRNNSADSSRLGVMYSDVETNRSMVILEDKGMSAQGVGAAPGLRDAMNKGRDEIAEAQQKLNSSLTTPIVDQERKVLDNGGWLEEKKDVNMRFNVLPPIADGKKVVSQGMAFNID